jgi:hypothetical protein
MRFRPPGDPSFAPLPEETPMTLRDFSVLALTAVIVLFSIFAYAANLSGYWQ